MRCEFCKSLRIDRLIELVDTESAASVFPTNVSHMYIHQPSITALEVSAQQGCDLCQLILQGLSSTRSFLYGSNRVKDPSVLERAREVKDADDTGIRISVNTLKPGLGIGLSNVKMLEILYARVGLPSSTNYDEPPQGVKLLLTSPRDTPSYQDQLKIGRSQFPTPESRESIAIARDWISTCRNEHAGACGIPGSSSPLPTRVIDVGSVTNVSQKPRLFISSGIHGEYVALSHCWGGPIATVLETGNIQDFCVALPYDQLPLNFKDAIETTRQLGVRYLWIDSLCIMQDSRDDWTIESTKMAAVYENALVTIAILCSPGSSYVMFSQSPHGQVKTPAKVQIHGPGHIKLSLEVFDESRDEGLDKLMAEAPLARRGWTLQESLLSKRVLFYGKSQIYWECGQGFKAADDIPGAHGTPTSVVGVGTLHEFLRLQTIAKSLPLKGDEWRRLLRNYYRIARIYTRRNLTYDSDKLPAFSGLAQRLHLLVGGDYVAGLWTADLKQGLLWHSDGGKPMELYLAPSWSWISSNGPVEFHQDQMIKGVMQEEALGTNDVEILEVEVLPKDKHAPYGQVLSGHIVVRGYTLRLRQAYKQQPKLCKYLGSVMFDVLKFDEKMPKGRKVYPCHSHMDHQDAGLIVISNPQASAPTVQGKVSIQEDEREYVILWVKEQWTKNPEIRCIVLEEVRDSQLISGVFRRVGYFDTGRWVHPLDLRDWKIRTLRII